MKNKFILLLTVMSTSAFAQYGPNDVTYLNDPSFYTYYWYTNFPGYFNPVVIDGVNITSNSINASSFDAYTLGLLNTHATNGTNGTQGIQGNIGLTGATGSQGIMGINGTNAITAILLSTNTPIFDGVWITNASDYLYNVHIVYNVPLAAIAGQINMACWTRQAVNSTVTVTNSNRGYPSVLGLLTGTVIPDDTIVEVSPHTVFCWTNTLTTGLGNVAPIAAYYNVERP